MCEREFCMFKHKKEQEISDKIESIDVNDDIVSVGDSGDDDEDIEDNAEEETVIDAVEMDKHESMNRTFSNPSQVHKNTLEETFKCEKCDFKTDRKSIMLTHKKESHNWCQLCYWHFSSQEILEKHTIQMHKD